MCDCVCVSWNDEFDYIALSNFGYERCWSWKNFYFIRITNDINFGMFADNIPKVFWSEVRKKMSSVDGDSKNFRRKFLSVDEEKKSKCPKGEKKI